MMREPDHARVIVARDGEKGRVVDTWRWKSHYWVSSYGIGYLWSEICSEANSRALVLNVQDQP